MPHLIVLGSGFAAFSLLKHLRNDFAITVVSPRNHFLFTPLLPSTTVGTIEFRSIIEPIRRARKNLCYYNAFAHRLSTEERTVECRGVAENDEFTLEYDILVIAVGATSSTFRIPGAAQYARFLRDLHDARILRQQIARCFERANLPGVRVEERRRLLHFVICGGGPTGVEFAAELHDFMVEDLQDSYPNLVGEARITLVEAAREILSTFDVKLRRYAAETFRRQRITLLTESLVTRVDATTVTLDDGTNLPYGLLLWSAGNGPTAFVESTNLPKDSRSRILVDGFFRVRGHRNIYAAGDCSIVEGSPLPATAQVAQQQGKYLAESLRRHVRNRPVKPFYYRHLGMLAYIGGNRALADLESFKGRGWTTWLFWRSTYLTRIVSFKNKILVLFDWMKALVFGRDSSHF